MVIMVTRHQWGLGLHRLWTLKAEHLQLPHLPVSLQLPHLPVSLQLPNLPVSLAPPPARVTAAPQPARVKTKRGKKPGKKEREQERRIAASRAPPAPPAQPSGTKRKSTNTNIPSQPSSSSSPLTKTFWLKMLASEQWLRSLNRKARSLESSCQVRIYIPDESGRYSSTSVEFSCWPF